MMKLFKLLVVGIVLGLYSIPAIASVEITGAGATFPYPLYSKMFDQYYKETKTKVNYQSIGSGGGIRQLKNRTVDFGASDAFLSDSKIKSEFIKDKVIKKKKTLSESDIPIVHIPICSGAVALTYNVPGVTSLKLTPDIIAGIYLGTINKWNDARIKKVNPTIDLPKLAIAPVYRSDGSGTTFIFTDYLTKVSQKWADKIGRGKAVNWPAGLGGKGNAGVAGMVQQVPGGIGYVGSVYSIQNDMPMASVKNKSGQFIDPTLKSITLSSSGKLPKDTRATITDTSAIGGYPISGLTWILVYKNQDYNGRSKAQARETVDLIRWMIYDGQKYTEPLNYSPLPKPLVKQADRLLSLVHYNNQKL